MKQNDLLLLGGITVAGVLLWPQIKKLFGGVSDAAEGVAQAGAGIGATVQSTGQFVGETGTALAKGIDFYKDNIFPPTAAVKQLSKPVPPALGLYPNTLAGLKQFGTNALQGRVLASQLNVSTPSGAAYAPPPLPKPTLNYTPTGFGSAYYSPVPTSTTTSRRSGGISTLQRTSANTAIRSINKAFSIAGRSVRIPTLR